MIGNISWGVTRTTIDKAQYAVAKHVVKLIFRDDHCQDLFTVGELRGRML
jgi:hypothetical protein